MYKDRIKLIGIIVKNIDKGYCGSNPVDYIVNVYELDMLVAMDISKLTYSNVKNLDNHLVNETDITEESFEKLLKDKGVGQAAIDYIMGRTVQHVNITDPEYEYIIEICHDKLPTSNQLLKPGINFITQDTSIYNIRGNNITKTTRTQLQISKNARNDQFADNYPKKILLEIIYTQGDGKTYWIRPGISEDYFCSPYARHPESFTERLWTLDDHYISDGRYMIFYPHSVEWGYSKKISNGYTIKKTSILTDEALKIPLIDGVRMRTPLGFVTVKKSKIIDDYRLIAKWTETDYESFA